MRRAIIVILDGLRRDCVNDEHTPNLMGFARERAATFANHRSVFPSATRVVTASLATGCYPGRHELQGNSLALIEDGHLVRHDAGHPDFLQHKRRVTGRSLAVPTLAERVRDTGGAIVFANVSPGATYAHDPDGHGHVYHRDGSFGPGREPLPAPDRLAVGPDLAGDRAMTGRFVSEILAERRPALAVLWLGHPDTTQHEVPLGSPEHIVALHEADRHAGMVMDAVARLKGDDDEFLLMIGSDHGHQTVTGIVDIEDELIAAGLKSSTSSGDVVVTANGTAALVYLHPDCADRHMRLAEFLRSRSWAGEVLEGDELARIGQARHHALAFAISMRADDKPNSFGVPGSSLAVKPGSGKPDRLNCGQHGGLGRYEQMPFLMIEGTGFAPGTRQDAATSIVDIAPTVLTHLRLDGAETMDGRPLQSMP